MTVRATGWIAVLVAVVCAAPATAQPARAQTPDGPRLELVEQRLAVDPNGDIVLGYLLTGLDGDELALDPPEAPPTEAPPTEAPPTEATAPDAAAPGTGPPADTTIDPAPTEPAAPEPPRLTLEITNYSALSDPDDVGQLVGSDVDRDIFRELGDAVDGVAIDARPLLTRDDDGTVRLDLVIGTDVTDSVEDRLKMEQPGLYPLRVELLRGDPADDDVVATAGTIVQRVAGAVDVGVEVAPPIDLSVVTVTPPVGPSASAADVTRAQRVLDGAVDLADSLDSPITLEVPPTLVAEMARTPAGSDRLATSLVDDEFVALPLLPFDVSAAVAADRADAYTKLVRAGEELLTEAVPTTPSRRDVWTTTVRLSAGGAQHLRDLGTRFVVIPGDLFEATTGVDVPATDRFVEAELPDGGDLPLLVVDPLSDQLAEDAADRILERSTATEWSVETLAEMLLEQAADDAAASDSAGSARSPARRSRVLSAPDLTSPDGRLLRALERLAATTPAVRFTAASALTGVTDVLLDGREPVTVQLPEVAGPSLAARVQLLDRTALEIASAGSMLPDDDPRIDEWSAQLETLISTGYSDAEVEAAVANLVAQAEEVKSSVRLPEPFSFTLTGRSGTIEVRIGNTSDEPLNVAVTLDSEKITFPEGDQVVTLRPLDETSVIVPVEAEANGTSSINLVVSTPAGEPLDEPVALTARVTALTGLGQVLTGGLALVLLTWWFTHWRSRRRSRQADDVRDRHPSARGVGSDPQ